MKYFLQCMQLYLLLKLACNYSWIFFLTFSVFFLIVVWYHFCLLLHFVLGVLVLAMQQQLLEQFRLLVESP